MFDFYGKTATRAVDESDLLLKEAEEAFAIEVRSIGTIKLKFCATHFACSDGLCAINKYFHLLLVLCFKLFVTQVGVSSVWPYCSTIFSCSISKALFNSLSLHCCE